jgi:hypothetical protein
MIRYMLDSGYPQANIRLILNRVPKRLDVTLDEIEQMLGLPILRRSQTIIRRSRTLTLRAGW